MERAPAEADTLQRNLTKKPRRFAGRGFCNRTGRWHGWRLAGAGSYPLNLRTRARVPENKKGIRPKSRSAKEESPALKARLSPQSLG